MNPTTPPPSPFDDILAIDGFNELPAERRAHFIQLRADELRYVAPDYEEERIQDEADRVITEISKPLPALAPQLPEGENGFTNAIAKTFYGQSNAFLRLLRARDPEKARAYQENLEELYPTVAGWSSRFGSAIGSIIPSAIALGSTLAAPSSGGATLALGLGAMARIAGVSAFAYMGGSAGGSALLSIDEEDSRTGKETGKLKAAGIALGYGVAEIGAEYLGAKYLKGISEAGARGLSQALLSPTKGEFRQAVATALRSEVKRNPSMASSILRSVGKAVRGGAVVNAAEESVTELAQGFADTFYRPANEVLAELGGRVKEAAIGGAIGGGLLGGAGTSLAAAKYRGGDQYKIDKANANTVDALRSALFSYEAETLEASGVQRTDPEFKKQLLAAARRGENLSLDRDFMASETFKEADQVLAPLGLHVVGVRGLKKLRGEGSANGVYFEGTGRDVEGNVTPAKDSVIFVDTSYAKDPRKVSVQYIMAHEAFHARKKLDPTVADRLIRAANPGYDADVAALSSAQAALSTAAPGTPERIEAAKAVKAAQQKFYDAEENAADFFAGSFEDPDFWATIQPMMPAEGFTGLMDSLLSQMEKVKVGSPSAARNQAVNSYRDALGAAAETYLSAAGVPLPVPPPPAPPVKSRAEQTQERINEIRRQENEVRRERDRLAAAAKAPDAAPTPAAEVPILAPGAPPPAAPAVETPAPRKEALQRHINEIRRQEYEARKAKRAAKIAAPPAAPPSTPAPLSIEEQNKVSLELFALKMGFPNFEKYKASRLSFDAIHRAWADSARTLRNVLGPDEDLALWNRAEELRAKRDAAKMPEKVEGQEGGKLSDRVDAAVGAMDPFALLDAQTDLSGRESVSALARAAQQLRILPSDVKVDDPAEAALLTQVIALQAAGRPAFPAGTAPSAGVVVGNDLVPRNEGRLAAFRKMLKDRKFTQDQLDTDVADMWRAHRAGKQEDVARILTELGVPEDAVAPETAPTKPAQKRRAAPVTEEEMDAEVNRVVEREKRGTAPRARGGEGKVNSALVDAFPKGQVPQGEIQAKIAIATGPASRAQEAATLELLGSVKGLVVNLAQGFRANQGVPADDLFTVGMTAIQRALLAYNPALGAFTTWAAGPRGVASSAMKAELDKIRMVERGSTSADTQVGEDGGTLGDVLPELADGGNAATELQRRDLFTETERVVRATIPSGPMQDAVLDRMVKDPAATLGELVGRHFPDTEPGEVSNQIKRISAAVTRAQRAAAKDAVIVDLYRGPRFSDPTRREASNRADPKDDAEYEKQMATVTMAETRRKAEALLLDPEQRRAATERLLRAETIPPSERQSVAVESMVNTLLTKEAQIRAYNTGDLEDRVLARRLTRGDKVTGGLLGTALALRRFQRAAALKSRDPVVRATARREAWAELLAQSTPETEATLGRLDIPEEEKRAIVEREEAKMEEVRERILRRTEDVDQGVPGIDIRNVSDEDLANDRIFATLAREMGEAFNPKGKGDWLYEYWRNSILSGIVTQFANIGGNAANGLWHYTVQGIVESALTAAGFAPKNQGGQRMAGRSFGELRRVHAAMLGHISTAFRVAKLAFDTEHDPAYLAGHDVDLTDRDTAIPGTAGRIIRLPQRALLFSDTFAKALIFEGERAGQAFRRAKAEGLEGEDLDRRAEALLDDVDVAKAAEEIGKKLTFQQDPGAFAQLLIQARKSDTPWVKWASRFLFPFIVTPVNILRTGLRKTPLGAINLAAKIKNGTATTEDYAEQVLAIGLFTLLAAALDPEEEDGEPWFEITGSAPSYRDRGRSELAERSRPPLSLRVNGGAWFSYARVEPFASVLAGLADMLEGNKYLEAGQAEEGAKVAFNGMVAQIRDKTSLSGVGDLIRFFEDDSGQAKAAWISRFATSFVPAIARQTARAVEGEVPENRPLSITERAAEMVAPGSFARGKLDVWGQEVRPSELVGGGAATDVVYRLVSPVRVQDARPMDFVDHYLYRWNLAHPTAETGRWLPTLPDRYVMQGKERTEMTPDEYRTYVSIRGQVASRVAERLRPRFGADVIPDERGVEILRSAFERGSALASSAILRARREGGG